MQLDSPVILGNPSEEAIALGNITGAVSIDLGASSYYTGTVTGDVTWTFTSAGALRGSLFQLTNAGGVVHTFPSSVKFPAGTAPVFTASGVDFLSVFSPDGITFFASLVIKDAK